MQVMWESGVCGSKLHTALGLLGHAFALVAILLTAGLILIAMRWREKKPRNG